MRTLFWIILAVVGSLVIYWLIDYRKHFAEIEQDDTDQS